MRPLIAFISGIGLCVSASAASLAASPAADPAPVPAKPAAQTEAKTTPDKPRSLEPDDQTLRVTGSADGKTIFMIGKLDGGSYLKFRRVALTLPKADTVFLGSQGGLVLEGYLIGTLVRERKMKTFVDALCASSCTQIFIAGAERIVAPNAKVGFHESYRTDENGMPIEEEPGTKNRNALMRASYARSGIATDFVTKALATPYSDMWYPDFAEMEKAKVLTRRAVGTEWRPPFTLGQSRAAIEESLLKRPFWQELQKRETKLFEDAIDGAWRSGQVGLASDQIPAHAQSIASDTLLERLSIAPDDVVDGYLTLINDQIQKTRGVDVSRCAAFGSRSGAAERSVSPQEFLDRELGLLHNMLTSPPVAQAITEAKAQKIILPVYLNVFRDGYSPRNANAKTPEFQCGFAASLFGNIAAMPRKKRIVAMRSMMIFGTATERAAKRAPELGAPDSPKSPAKTP
jgi:hypothetical protein